MRLFDAGFGVAPAAHRRDWLKWTVRNYDALAILRQPPYGDYAVTTHDGSLIGSVGLVPCLAPFDRLPWFRDRLKTIPTNLFRSEVGLFWAIGPDHRRLGYASEAAWALADFAFNELRVERVVAMTENDNAASIAVMRHIGMTVERNPDPEPPRLQTVAMLANPAAANAE